MFGLGIGEFVLVLVVALIVLGPKQLPKVARQLGRATREFKRAAREFQNTLSEVDLDKEVEEYKSRVADLQKDVEKTLQEPDKSSIPTSEDAPFNLELPDGVVSQEDPIDSLPPATNDVVSKPEEKN